MPIVRPNFALARLNRSYEMHRMGGSNKHVRGNTGSTM